MKYTTLVARVERRSPCDENDRRATLQRYRPGVESSLTVLADTAHNYCFRMRVEFSPFPCRFPRQNDCSRSSLPSTTSTPRHLSFLKKSPKFSKVEFSPFPPNLPERTTVPVHPRPQQPQPAVISFVLKMPDFNSTPTRLTTILTWASMAGNYMINVW